MYSDGDGHVVFVDVWLELWVVKGLAFDPPIFCFDLFFDEPFIVHEMSGSSLQLIAMAAQAATGKDKLEARLLSLCMNAGVSNDMMDKMGTNGLTTVSLLTNICLTKEACVEMFKAPPFDLSGTDFGTKMEIGKLVSVYVASSTNAEVQLKADAERILLNLPPQINPLDMDTAKKIFHTQFPKVVLSMSQEPSKPFFERKILEVETAFIADQLTTVTNRSQEELMKSTPPDVGVDIRTGCFKTSTKEFGVPMPSTPEGLRARLNLLGICYVFLKQRFPGKGVLRSVEPLTFHYYVEWLLGPTVWGCASLDLNMKPIATPTLQHVLIYDRAIRAKMVELMNEGVDLDSALEAAKKDSEIRSMNFITHVATDINTPQCRAITAPGFAECSVVHTKVIGGGRNSGNDELLPAAKLKKLKNQLKQEAEATAKRKFNQLMLGNTGIPGQGLGKKARQKANQAARALAIGNGGVGDSQPNGAGYPRLQGGGSGSQKGAGKGTGKGKKGKEDTRFEGKPICFNWNRGAPCKSGPSCTMAHVCLKCHDTHPKIECTA